MSARRIHPAADSRSAVRPRCVRLRIVVHQLGEGRRGCLSTARRGRAWTWQPGSIASGSSTWSAAIAIASGAGFGQPFVQIATDGGLLARPVPAVTIPLAMAERVEVVVDFSRYPPGTRVVPGESVRALRRPDHEVRRAQVGNRIRVVPDRLADVASISTAAAVRTRRFVFAGRPRFGPVRNSLTINGEDFAAARPIASPRYGDVEIFGTSRIVRCSACWVSSIPCTCTW